MPKVNIELNDYSAEVLEAMRDQVQLALKSIGAEAEGYAKDDCPVDTGRLRNSIAWATTTDGSGDAQATPEENTLYIGTNVEYAVYVEYGDATHKVGKKHFLRDSLNHGDDFKAIMEAALKA